MRLETASLALMEYFTPLSQPVEDSPAFTAITVTMACKRTHLNCLAETVFLNELY